MAATLETTEERSRKRTRYSEEEIEQGLLVLAFNGGRPQKASDQLAEQFNLHIPATTLCKWRDRSRTERYAAIAHETERREIHPSPAPRGNRHRHSALRPAAYRIWL